MRVVNRVVPTHGDATQCRATGERPVADSRDTVGDRDRGQL